MLNKYEINMKKIKIMSQDGNVSDHFTPAELCQEILDKIDVVDKKILTFNIEFVLTLVHKYDVKKPNITIYTDDDIIRGICERCGINCIDTMEPNMKFDVVVGNPPYESATADGRKDQANNLWSKFTKKAFEIVKKDGVVAFVTPTSWLSPAADIGKGKNGIRFIRDYFQKLSVVYMNINECAKHFSVGSTFSYFVVKNTETTAFKTEILTDETSYTIDLRDIEYFPKTMNKLAISISKKTLEHSVKFGFIGNNLPECRIEFVRERTDEYDVPAYHTPAKGGTYWYAKEHISTSSRKKVVVSISGEFNPVYDNIGELNFTNMCKAYYLNSNDNMESIKSFLGSKLIKFLMKQNKYTGWVAPIINDLPIIDKTKLWVDEELYTHFNLTQEEIDYIEANVE